MRKEKKKNDVNAIISTIISLVKLFFSFSFIEHTPQKDSFHILIEKKKTLGKVIY